MITKKSLFFLLGFGLSLLILATACGPSIDPTNNNTTTGETETAVTNNDQTESNTNQPTAETNTTQNAAPQIEVVDSAIDARGIQVGFTADGHAYRGNPDAPVVLEEFSDFQCPFCSRFSAQTLPSLVENQIKNGELLLVYYDFPLDNLHPQARAAANAARCAGEQGPIAYWDIHDLIYANTQEWGNNNANQFFAKYGEELGLDMGAFSSCLENNKYAEQVQADVDFGSSRGIRSTPSFFVNGQSLVGAQPLSIFNQAIAAVQQGESIAQEAPESTPQEAPKLDDYLVPPPQVPERVELTTDNAAMVLGDPNAPVTIVEFTDFQCPYCQRFSLETMPKILENMIESGEVYFILKDLPLESIHPEARAAANAARCAGEQDAYLEMHDALFNSQSTWSGNGNDSARESFAVLATELDLDTDAFAACLDSNQYDAAVELNIIEAFDLEAQSTPYFFVNGLPVSGAQPYELFEYAVSLAKEGELQAAYGRPEPNISEAYSIGDPNAPVQIIEFTDYQCPFCSRYYSQSYKQIKEKYVDTGQVYYVFKDFPLTNIHPQAAKAAEAARCAGDQDSYLEMHDMLFEKQAEWNNQPTANQLFINYATDLGLDSASFQQCLDSGQHTAVVNADLEEGSGLGVSGTPAFFINNHSINGALPYALFEEAIERFLTASSST
ncbi:MAG: thioredoxin domain-containing protein [Anaerolineales bacterium]|nr:thioredoxin domain-containing protein [Anaerolineales bacterium]